MGIHIPELPYIMSASFSGISLIRFALLGFALQLICLGNHFLLCFFVFVHKFFLTFHSTSVFKVTPECWHFLWNPECRKWTNDKVCLGLLTQRIPLSCCAIIISLMQLMYAICNVIITGCLTLHRWIAKAPTQFLRDFEKGENKGCCSTQNNPTFTNPKDGLRVGKNYTHGLDHTAHALWHFMNSNWIHIGELCFLSWIGNFGECKLALPLLQMTTSRTLLDTWLETRRTPP